MYARGYPPPQAFTVERLFVLAVALVLLFAALPLLVKLLLLLLDFERGDAGLELVHLGILLRLLLLLLLHNELHKGLHSLQRRNSQKSAPYCIYCSIY